MAITGSSSSFQVQAANRVDDDDSIVLVLVIIIVLVLVIILIMSCHVIVIVIFIVLIIDLYDDEDEDDDDDEDKDDAIVIVHSILDMTPRDQPTRSSHPSLAGVWYYYTSPTAACTWNDDDDPVIAMYDYGAFDPARPKKPTTSHHEQDTTPQQGWGVVIRDHHARPHPPRLPRLIAITTAIPALSLRTTADLMILHDPRD
ncbi:hypothetical protein BS47DRAFT_1390660 [Hydnum rufescens UP504]|uniref:Uncharacterized protein n=1 Tax=Hydnum rufescens UP504 TaxID=1448309 RepID=A0A9P6B3C1_9AGAM|nr:hypothetical protein BS47DRAFT_1390660 [Hydnum rufescens UP504]